MYKETKARLQKTQRQSYWKFIDNIIQVGDPDQEQQPKQKRFWAYIKSLRKDSSGIAPLKDNGTFHANPKDKADILNRQYESTWTKEDKSNIPTPDGTPFPSMPEIKVTCEGVRKLLQRLNPGKACGPDLLPARVLKELASEISPLLTTIFQKSLDTGYLVCTEGLENSKCHCNFQKWEKFKPSNYRPVSLTIICCKIRENVNTSNRAGTINRNIGKLVDIQTKNDYRYENSKIGYF